MSYDVSIVSECGDFSADVGNYTYNLAAYFQWAIQHDDGLRYLDGMSSADALPLLNAAVTRTNGAKFRIGTDGSLLSDFNPENGWGSVDGARKFLTVIAAACTEHPKGKLRVT